MTFRYPGEVRSRIYLGAEAEILGVELNGGAILKRRLQKTYRNKSLDEALNKRRTLRELRLLHECKLAGVRTPAILAVNLREHTIITEFIHGMTLRSFLKERPVNECVPLMKKLGELVGRLHKADLTHGDLTTSNVMVEPNGSLALLDIGLGEKTKEREKKAVDLVILMRVLESDHHDRARVLMRAFLEGYRSTYKAADETVRRARRIKSMGRYFEIRG